MFTCRKFWECNHLGLLKFDSFAEFISEVKVQLTGNESGISKTITEIWISVYTEWLNIQILKQKKQHVRNYMLEGITVRGHAENLTAAKKVRI